MKLDLKFKRLRSFALPGILPAVFSAAALLVLLPTPARAEWKAWTLSRDPETIYLKDPAITRDENLNRAMKRSRRVFTALTEAVAGHELDLWGPQTELEHAADEACVQAKAGKLPEIAEEKVLENVRIEDESQRREDNAASPSTPPSATANLYQTYSAGTLASTLEFPVREKPRFASLVVTCRDPAGARFANAQRRGMSILPIHAYAVGMGRAMKFKRTEDRVRFFIAEGHAHLRQMEANRTWLDTDSARAGFSGSSENRDSLTLAQKLTTGNITVFREKLAPLEKNDRTLNPGPHSDAEDLHRMLALLPFEAD